MTTPPEVSLTGSVSARLRRDIISGRIGPGWRLTEGWVAENFDVARPTAKAALEALKVEGILKRGQRKSAFVPVLTAADISDIYFARELVEGAAVDLLAAGMTESVEARRALRTMRRATHDVDLVEHIEGDIAFHVALVEASESERLVRLHQSIIGESQLCIAQVQSQPLADLDRITQEHEAIFAAIVDGDRAAARAALEVDLRGSRDRLIDGVSATESATRSVRAPAPRTD